MPILVTENGIATADDDRRIAYTSEALEHLFAAVADGIDVRGYLHWSALDNFEWGHWEPTFGLIAVDRETFARQPKPSLDLARGGRPSWSVRDSSPQRWAAIGTGTISRSVVPDLQSCDGASVVTVQSRDGDKAARFAEEFGIPASTDDYGAVLADPQSTRSTWRLRSRPTTR